MSKKRRPRRRDEEYLDEQDELVEDRASEADDDYARERTSRKRRKGGTRGWWMLRLGIVGMMLGALVWFLPAIVCSPLAWGTVLSTVNSKLNGRVEMARPSLGWLSPVVIKDLKVHSKTEENLVTVEAIRTEHSLLSLAMSPSNLGLITVERPNIRAVVRAEGSNLEDLLIPQPQPAPASKPTRITLALKVIEAKVQVRDGTTGDDYQIEPLNAVVSLPANEKQEGQAEIEASFAAGSGASAHQAGAINAKLRWLAAPPGGALPISACLADAHIASLDLGALQPMLKRFIPGLQLQGTLSCQVKVHIDETAQKRTLDLAQLAGDRLLFAAPGLLGADQIKLDQVKIRGKVESEGREWTIRDMQLESDLAQLKADGQVQLGDGSLTNVLSSLANIGKEATLTANARLDLARLAQLLPNTLHLKAGTAISDGDVTANLKVEPTAAGPKLTGRLQMSDLVAQNQGRTVRWKDPLSATFAVQQSSQGVAIEQLQCDASFLKVTAAGTLEKGQLTARGDLAQLAAEVEQLVDFGDIEPAGALNVKLNWQRQDQDDWGAQGELRLTNLAVALAGGKTWRENELVASLDVLGRLRGTELAAIERGAFRIVAGKDQLDATLVKPVQPVSADAVWPVNIKIHGDVAAWLARATPFADLKAVALAGRVELEAAADAGTSAVDIQELKLTADSLQGRVGNVFLDEPRIEIHARGAWEGKKQAIHVPEATFASSSVAFRVVDLEANLDPKSFHVTGEVDYRAKVDQVSRWFHDPKQPLLGEFRGDVDGKLTIDVQQGVTTAKLDCDVNQLAYAEPPQAMAQSNLQLSSMPLDRWLVKWQEPKVVLRGQIAFDPAKDTLRLSKAEIQASKMAVSASGEIVSLNSPQAMCNLNGELAYDMADIAEKLRPYAGPSLELDGQQRRRFTLKGPLAAPQAKVAANANHPATEGPLVSNDLAGEASIGWAAASYAGFVVGPADFTAKLDAGELSLLPFELSVGDGGKIRASGKMLLNDPRQMLLLPNGPLMERVHLSPDMCRTWLKFIAPQVADATHAEGKLSLNLEDTSVPLADPKKCDAAGSLTIHQAQIGPGPNAQPYVKLVRQIREILDGKTLPTDLIKGFILPGNQPAAQQPDVVWMQMPEQNIEFRVVDGKVHHRGLRYVIKDFEVTTEGAVGLDQSIEITASIPVRDEWIKADAKPWIQAWKGKTIKVPIRGTVDKPQIDMTALLQQAGAQSAGGGIQNLIQEKVGGAVNKGVDQGTNKVNDLQQGIENKLNQELGNGLKKLFGPKK